MAKRDSTQRFSERVVDYVKYRPDYPESLIDDLFAQCQPQTIADIGAGTGIFSRLLLSRGATVYAVEPNAEMRIAGEAELDAATDYHSVDARAEHTGLANGSVDLITAAQAFHWFNNAATKSEFGRILQPGGWLALIWNKRNLENPFQRAYQDVLHEYAPEYSRVNHMNLTDAQIAEYFSPGHMRIRQYSNAQMLELTALIGRLRSASYCPAESSQYYRTLVQTLESLFYRHAHNGKISFEYDCRLYHGPLQR